MTQARDALDQTTRELSAIFDTDALGIAIVVDGTMVRCNRCLEEILAPAPGALTGRSPKLFYKTEAEHAQALVAVQPAFAVGDVYHGEPTAQTARLCGCGRAVPSTSRFPCLTVMAAISGCVLWAVWWKGFLWRAAT